MCNFLTYLFFSIAVSIISLYFKLVKLDDDILCETCFTEGINQEYDFIIVGAGTAGSTIAGLLALNSSYSILVLEAGGLGRSLFDIPFVGPMLQGTDYDWQYETVPQNKACLALKEQVSKWPMGKIVGGTSRLNNMIHVQGNNYDYKDWFYQSTTDYEEEIQSIFRKIESYLPANYLLYNSLLSELFIRSGEEAGYVYSELDNLGFHKVKVNQLFGSRYTTSHIYLLQNNKSSNITLLINSEVKKLLIKKDKVYGVKYERNDKVLVTKAQKGVILSAGVIGTPKLLMLSGIGPKEHLEELDIPVLHNLPVGNNLQDHVTTGIDLITVNSSLNLSLLDILSPKAVYDYFMGYGGPWSNPGCEANAFLNTLDNNKDFPDLQLMALPLGMTKDAGAHIHKLFGLKTQIWDDYYYDLSFKNTITILPIVLHPESKGTVRLSSSNPKANPLIDPKYLSSKQDLDVLIKGIRIIQKLLDTDSMKKIDARIERKHFPGCEGFVFDTDDYWECYIRHMTLTTFHPAGTCKLGPYEHPETVVDKNTFKVKGINNLFVADASVFPNLPSGNINAAVILVAEKFVQYILETRDFKNLKEDSCHAKHVFFDDLKCTVKNILYSMNF